MKWIAKRKNVAKRKSFKIRAKTSNVKTSTKIAKQKNIIKRFKIRAKTLNVKTFAFTNSIRFKNRNSHNVIKNLFFIQFIFFYFIFVFDFIVIDIYIINFLNFIKNVVLSNIVKHIFINKFATSAFDVVFQHFFSIIKHFNLTKLKKVFKNREISQKNNIFLLTLINSNCFLLTNIDLQKIVKWNLNNNNCCFEIFSNW